jgi:hypothetical protein
MGEVQHLTGTLVATWHARVTPLKLVEVPIDWTFINIAQAALQERESVA